MDKLIELLQSVFLGVVQGVAEFLPVSSSGHLAIFKNIFGMEDVGVSFDVLLHIGTLIAVFIVYWKDIISLISDGIGIIIDFFANIGIFINNRVVEEKKAYRKVICNGYRKFAMLVVVSTIPTGIIGLLGEELIDQASATLIVPGVCLLITGTLLLISDSLPDGKKVPKTTSYGNAIFIGIAQGIATLPGISRSGTSITAELACGLKRDFAVKYSFIMSIPAILGAAVLKLKDFGSEGLGGYTMFTYAVGMLVSAIVGYICIKTMLVVVRNKKFKYFAYYCYAVGVVAIIGHFVI